MTLTVPTVPTNRPLADYLELRRTFTREAFLEKNPEAVLVTPVELGPREEDPLVTGVMSIKDLSPPKVKADSRIVPLVKRANDAFRTYLWVGREPQCDVHLPFDCVSKLHARITRASDGSHDITDLGSKNGTFVDGVRLAQGKGVRLVDGRPIRFGVLETRYVTAERLWEELGIAI